MGNFSLQSFDLATVGATSPIIAEKMIGKLRTGMMPPPGRPRPAGDTLEVLTETLERQMDALAVRKPDIGRRSFQRLNRAEYERAIKDLLTLSVNAESWLPPGAWQACEDKSLVIPDGANITVGIDVALYHDHTAVVVAYRNDEGRVIVRARTWEPPADGSGIDAADVVAYVRELSLTYNILAASYDPRFFDVPARTLADEGVEMLEEPQSPERMVPACGHAYSTHSLRHTGYLHW
jgi:hypothetical protein